MSLPFTTEEFFAVFRDYNEALWPSQVFLNGLAVIAVGFVIWPRKDSGPIISAILALLWAWLALAYHLAFFARINPLAYAFAIVSLAGAIAFVWQGVILRRLQFLRADGARGYTGGSLIVFSLIVYPVWSLLEGHPYPFMPTFGLPCPTTIFTIGMLAFLAPPYPRAVFVVPVLWCLVGATAAFLLGISQDLALLVAGGAGVILSFRATRSSTVK